MACEYCTPKEIDTKNLIEEGYGKDEVFVFIEGNRLYVESYSMRGNNLEGSVEIKSCPKCKRDLNKEE